MERVPTYTEYSSNTVGLYNSLTLALITGAREDDTCGLLKGSKISVDLIRLPAKGEGINDTLSVHSSSKNDLDRQGAVVRL